MSPKPTKSNNKFISPPVAKKLIIAITAYYLIYAAVYTVLGKDAASWIATPLWGVPIFIITKWDRLQPHQPNASWREVFSLPKINILVTLFTLIVVLVYQFLFAFLLAMYLERVSPNFGESLPDNTFEMLKALADQWELFVPLVVYGYSSYFVGGYVAGKLSQDIRSAYNSATAASFVFLLVNLIYMLSIFNEVGELEDTSVVEIVGGISLTCLPAISLSILGARIALKKQFPIRWFSKKHFADNAPVNLAANNSKQAVKSQEPSSTPEPETTASVRRRSGTGRRLSKRGLQKGKRTRLARGDGQASPEVSPPPDEQSPNLEVRKSRLRFFALSACIVLASLIGIIAWTFSSKSTDCPNPPLTATLNYWPVTYSSPAEACHDYPTVDAGITKEGHGSRSQEEWERGLTARSDDEIIVLVYINNGAIDEAEEINPGRGIARNVRLTTEINPEPNSIHYINVRIRGDNTNVVSSKFKIMTAVHERLEVVPQSGSIYNYKGSELIATDIHVGNNTISVGDLPPKWKDSIFVRFRLKVTV